MLPLLRRLVVLVVLAQALVASARAPLHLVPRLLLPPLLQALLLVLDQVLLQGQAQLQHLRQCRGQSGQRSWPPSWAHCQTQPPQQICMPMQSGCCWAAVVVATLTCSRALMPPESGAQLLQRAAVPRLRARLPLRLLQRPLRLLLLLRLLQLCALLSWSERLLSPRLLVLLRLRLPLRLLLQVRWMHLQLQARARSLLSLAWWSGRHLLLLQQPQLHLLLLLLRLLRLRLCTPLQLAVPLPQQCQCVPAVTVPSRAASASG